MNSQKKEFKPTYGSFSGREAIEMVTRNTQKNMPQKVPFNIGFPSIKRGGAKIKVTFPKPQDCVKELNVSYSRQMNKIITTQKSSPLITNGNRSSTPAKPSITTQASLGDKSAVNRPSSQVASSISNKSTSANIQTHPSSLDKSPTTTVSPNSHIPNANNTSYNAAKNGNGSLSTSINSAANYSRSIPNCSTSRAPINTLNDSNVNNSQQNNASNSTDATKSNSLPVQSQQKNGFINGTVWNGVNSKVVNPPGAIKESSPGSMTVRSQHINSVAANSQHQPVGRNSRLGNKTPQYGPSTNVTSLIGVGKEPFLGSMIVGSQQNYGAIGNTSVVPSNSSNGTSGKMNTVWNGINGSLKEPSGLTNVTQQISSRRSSTSNGLNNAALKEQTPSLIKYKQQKELDNKNNTSSVTTTPSSSRRSSESNGSDAINNIVEPIKHVARQVEADYKSNISSVYNTPSSSRRPSESNGSKDTNSIVESNSEQRNGVNNNATIVAIKSTSSCTIKHPTSDGNTNGKLLATTSLLSSEKNKNNGLNSGSTQGIQSSNKQPSNERSNNVMNWAVHLFPKDENQRPTTVVAESSKSNVTKPQSPPVKPQRPQKPVVPLTNGKPKVGGLAGLLKDFDPSFQDITMSPRGLVNNGNMCFMNAILQTLSHCPPFCNLLTRIHKEVAHNFNSKTPLVDSLVRFTDEYKQMKRSEGSEEFGEAFSPEYVYDALRGLKRFDSMKGRQEDAEEFLGFLLDGLHEEFLAALKKDEPKSQQSDKAVKANVKSNQKDDVWMEVGPKNRTSYTRTTDVEETPISRIFGGQFRSILSCPGSTDSITLQPYQSLQLDIQPDDVKTIGDALKNLTVPEYVDDFYSPKNGLVRATKRLYIETLPPILTLHLKRFVYDNVGGTQKLSKHIGYSTTLSIQPDIMAQARRPNKAVEYRLFGVVYHHGKSATGGHYTADILCRNDWLHIDDTAISSISSEEVASVENPTQPTDRSAYILFYMRN